jgi:hypothetical protein
MISPRRSCREKPNLSFTKGSPSRVRAHLTLTDNWKPGHLLSDPDSNSNAEPQRDGMSEANTGSMYIV